MTTDPVNSSEEARQLLTSSHELIERVRQKQRATWFPLFVMSAITFLAIPILRFSHHNLTSCAADPRGGFACHAYSTWGVWYWPVALVLAYLGISVFYIRRSLAQGLEPRIRIFLIAGILTSIVVTALGYWVVHLPISNVDLLGLQTQEGPMGLVHRIATPSCAIGISLLVLAQIEHNRRLLVVDIVYLIVVLVPISFGWNLSHSKDWNFLPRLMIDGALLLMAGIGFAVAESKMTRSTK